MRQCLTAERRMPSREYIEENPAQPMDVDPRVGDSLHLLRSHVARCAGSAHSGGAYAIDRHTKCIRRYGEQCLAGGALCLRDAPVENQHLTESTEHDVL